MSDIVATTKVRIVPETAGLQQEATKQINAAVPEFKEVKLSLDSSALIQASQTATERLAATRREVNDIKKRLLDLGDTRRQAEAAGGPILEAFKRQQEEFAKGTAEERKNDEPALRERQAALVEQLAVEERLAASAKRRAQAQIDADLAVVAGAEEATVALETEAGAARDAARAGGGRGGLGGTLRSVTAGRTAGIGGLIAMTSRLGLVGFAASTAFQAVGELQKAIAVTGDEAFTSTGRIRNFAAELVGGNLIGGIKALFAIKQARLLGDLPAQIQAMKDKNDNLAITEEKLIEIRAKGAESLKVYVLQMWAAGRISASTAEDLVKVTEELWKQQKATTAAGDAILDFTQKLEKSGKDRLRKGAGSGFMFQQTGLPPGQAFGSPQAARDAGQANLNVMNTIRASITARIRNDRERATQELEDAKIIESQTIAAARAAFGTERWGAAKAAQVQAETNVLEKTRALAKLANDERALSQQRNNSIAQAQAGLLTNTVKRAAADLEIAKTVRNQAKTTLASAKGVQEINAAWTAYRLAVIGVQSATQASKEAVEQAARDAQALGDSVRESIASRIPAEQGGQQALLRAARIEEKNARVAFEAKRHTDQANDRWNDYVAAKTKTILIEQAIAAASKAAADAAKQSATNAQQQALQNAITVAEQSGSIPAIKNAYDKAIAYWQTIASGAKTTEEARQQAIAQVLSLTAAEKSAISQTGVRQAKLQNAVALADLKGLDTRPFLKAMVNFAFEAMNNAKAGTLAFEQAKGAWIAARANLKGANDTLNDLKRANAKARAALTESEKDDEKLVRAEIRRLEKKVRDTKGLGIVHQRAIAELLAAEQELKGMVDEIKPTTTVFDLLTASTKAFTEHAGNIINAGNRFTADSFTGGIRGQIGTTPNAAGRARLGQDSNVIATNNNTAALDRLTALLGRGGFMSPRFAGGGGGAGPSNAGTRWGSGAWTAWQSKAGVN